MFLSQNRINERCPTIKLEPDFGLEDTIEKESPMEDETEEFRDRQDFATQVTLPPIGEVVFNFSCDFDRDVFCAKTQAAIPPDLYW